MIELTLRDGGNIAINSTATAAVVEVDQNGLQIVLTIQHSGGAAIFYRVVESVEEIITRCKGEGILYSTIWLG